MTPITVGDAICPDWLVYHTNMTGDWEIFRLGELPDEPGAEANLTQGVGDRIYDVSPGRSPDAAWIAFASNRDGNWELYIGRTNGSEQSRVTFNTFAIDTAPAWSPNGQYIAFRRPATAIGASIWWM
jgi:Tol biopolymer transport system component